MKKNFFFCTKQQEKVIFAATLSRTPYEYGNIVRLCCRTMPYGYLSYSRDFVVLCERMAISLRGTCLSAIGTCCNGREQSIKQPTLPNQ